MSKVTGIILAAGSGTRMGQNKMLMDIAGRTPIEWCKRAFENSSVDEIVFAVSRDTIEFCKALPCSKPKQTVLGGASRAESVYRALLVCKDTDIAVIHDGARCLVTGKIINKSIECAKEFGSAIACTRMHDTVRTEQGKTLNRDGLLLMQTPQSFDYGKILKAYGSFEARENNTDDCGIFIADGGIPHYFEADFTNQKLTDPSDISFFEAVLKDRDCDMRIGCGEDTHRLCEGRKLILGGVNIEWEMGLLGHSDADALCHAICDAMLGACALGDIGKHFPDTDPAYEGISSLLLLQKTAELLRAEGYETVNVDAVITAQEPKLAPYIDLMRENISQAINTEKSRVSVKATTPEHTGPEGRLECITVRAVVCVRFCG